MIHKIEIKTSSQVEFQEITVKVRDIVAESGIKSGVCYVFVPHTTAGVMVNEHADPSVVEDIAAQLDVMVPRHKSYRHLEGNSPAHIKAAIVGDSETLFIEDGKLVLGTWQGVFFCEFDGPRNRNVMVRIVPDNGNHKTR
ncbi:MAG TPA: secondary thiamine-phosphate synthase enzyme YjbQ [Dehalococcoidales bacterium]|nr:secondary thiamine-phosphate synthase enzyme YjbQ [Dehalococcoidales bacterium]